MATPRLTKALADRCIRGLRDIRGVVMNRLVTTAFPSMKHAREVVSIAIRLVQAVRPSLPNE